MRESSEDVELAGQRQGERDGDSERELGGESGRRRFLSLVSIASAVLTGLIAGFTPVAAALSPAFRRPRAARWVRVVPDVNSVDIGVPFKVDFIDEVQDGWIESRALRSVWLSTEDAVEFKAWSGVCTHLGCSVSFDTEKDRFHCPCHHGLFDKQSGEVLGGPPPRGLDPLPVKVENDEVFVQYVTFRVGTERREPL